MEMMNRQKRTNTMAHNSNSNNNVNNSCEDMSGEVDISQGKDEMAI